MSSSIVALAIVGVVNVVAIVVVDDMVANVEIVKVVPAPRG